MKKDNNYLDIMTKVSEILNKKDFTISVEIVPPRNGISPEEIFNNIAHLRGLVDFVSITKGAGGSLRGGTLPLSHLIQEKFDILPIVHYVCRERTRQEIENDLVDLHMFGLSNVLALRGDKPAGSDEPWSGDYKYAYKLVEQIKNMNAGNYLPRNEKEKPFHKGVKTDFCTLVAGHPEDPIEQEIIHMKKKVEAGAQIILTQMIFSFKEYQSYVEHLRKAGIDLPVIPGIRPLKTTKQIESLERFFGLKVPKKLKDGIKNEGEKYGLKHTVDFINKLKDFKAPGAHFFVLNDIEYVPHILNCVNSPFTTEACVSSLTQRPSPLRIQS
jgi:methylenetetrahydrofolate reductase (NADPH)